MDSIIKKILVSLTIAATLGSGAREASAVVPPIPADPEALAILGVFGVVALGVIGAAKVAEGLSDEPADAEPSVPYDPDCLKGEAGVTGCLPPHAPSAD